MKNQNFKRSIGVSSAALVVALAACGPSPSSEDLAQGGTANGPADSGSQLEEHKLAAVVAKPNIVVILTDDTGWNGTSVRMLGGRADSKSDYHETPNVARLASSGIVLGSGYGAPNCSPSRLSLLTGKTPARLKMTDIIERAEGTEYEGHPLLPPGHVDNPAGRITAIPAGDQTIAELVKAHDASYATAHFGKWHLDGGGPAEHGFDESDGATGNAEGNVGGADPKRVFSLAEKARDFIARRAAAQKPFYLQISHYATHEKAQALAATIAKYQAKPPGTVHTNATFAAMLENLDTAVGRTLDALADPNGDGNQADSLLPTTYIVFLSDNGAVDSIANNFPLQAGKASTYEGGVRVPFIVAGPGIPAASRSTVPVSEFDLLPTVAEWLGATPQPKGTLDGGSFARLLRGEATVVEGRGTAIASHFPHYQTAKGSKPMSSIRVGNDKLVHFYETGQNLLFDLSTDLGEQSDQAAARPERVRTLLRQLRDYLKTVQAPLPRLNPDFGPGPATDVDQDGLGDDWEFRQLLTTKYSGSDDPDGDGKSNAVEFANKTDPLP